MCIKNIQLPGHRGQKYRHLMQLIMIDNEKGERAGRGSLHPEAMKCQDAKES